MPTLAAPDDHRGRRSLRIDMTDDVRAALENLNKSINNMQGSDHDNDSILQNLAFVASAISSPSEFDPIAVADHAEKMAAEIKGIRAGFGNLDTLVQGKDGGLSEEVDTGASLASTELVADWNALITGNEFVLELCKLLAPAGLSDPSLSKEVGTIFSEHADSLVRNLQSLVEDKGLELTAHAALLQADETQTS